MTSDTLVNPLKAMWDRGEAAVGTMMLVLSDPAAVQIAAAAGMDFIIFDLEHRPQDSQTLHHLCQVARLAGMAALVTPKDIEHHAITHALDLGANGVILPHVETIDEVKLGLSAVRYPPHGTRGAAGVAGHNMYVPHPIAEQIAAMNEQTLLLLKVESESAIDHLEELVAPEGVHGVMVGPLDLSVSMGLPGQASSPRVGKLIARVQAVCRQRGITYGANASTPDEVRAALDSGAEWVIASYDGAALRNDWKACADAKRRL